MTTRPLAGRSVLVTRPEHQAGPLCDAIEAAGGKAVRFPVMDVVPRDADEVAADLETCGAADLVIFVSRNAVDFGLAAIPGTGGARPQVAAIGKATAARLGEAGIDVDVRPGDGFTSEDLLALPALRDVSGRRITIVRGEPGRELLAETLRRRGAIVNYLSVYATRAHRFPRAAIDDLAKALHDGDIDAAVIMSAATLDLLLATLPADAAAALAGLRLVAPGRRVIKTIEDRLPGARCVEAPGPGARTMVAALIDSIGAGDKP